MQRYSVTEIAFPGGGDSYAFAVSNSGFVVGTADNGDGMTAFLWFNGEMIDLGQIVPGQASAAYDVNDLGVAVGAAGVNVSAREPIYEQPFVFHAAIFENGGIQDLLTLGQPGIGDNQPNSAALGINNLGQVVGASQVGQNEGIYPFIYQNGGMQGMVVPPGSVSYGALPSFAAMDINDAGLVAVADLSLEAPYIVDTRAQLYTNLSDAMAYPTTINSAGYVYAIWDGAPASDTQNSFSNWSFAAIGNDTWEFVAPMASVTDIWDQGPGEGPVQMPYLPVGGYGPPWPITREFAFALGVPLPLGAMNDIGQVAGTNWGGHPIFNFQSNVWSQAAPQTFYWDPTTGGPVPIASLINAGTNSNTRVDVLSDINDSGWIVGWRAAFPPRDLQDNTTSPARAVLLKPEGPQVVSPISGGGGGGEGWPGPYPEPYPPSGTHHPIETHPQPNALFAAGGVLAGVGVSALSGFIPNAALARSVRQLGRQVMAESALSLAGFAGGIPRWPAGARRTLRPLPPRKWLRARVPRSTRSRVKPGVAAS